MPNIDANGISLHYESLGNESDPPILLIMGLAVQMIVWPDEFCQLLVNKGFRVIRFDNRDVGLSTHLDHLSVPNVSLAYAKFVLRLPLKAPYLIDDMVADTAALIDALGLKRPHVVGASMGGMIAQNLAANYPDKLASLTSIMSTTGRRSLPKPSWKTMRAIMQPPAKPGDTQGAIDRMVKVLGVISSKTYPPDPARVREFCTRHIMRANYPQGGTRQLLAIAASDDRTYTVRRIKAPTLVIHGDEDKLVSPVCGMETAREIVYGGGKAKISIIKGMAHDFPLPLIPQIADEIIAHCRASPT
ncbi:MAG: alpha/beta hydrolase [Betaproteobacteria bacterium]